MRKSLNELQQIEAYLLHKMVEQEQQDFQIQLLVNPVLRAKVSLQEKAYDHIRTYGRSKLKAELQLIHEKLFQHPEKESFRKKIKKLFI